MKRILVVCVWVLVIMGCGKDRFQTTPSLKIKSTSDKVIPLNGTLRVVLEFTDKEGDLDDTLLMKKVRLNKRAAIGTVRDSIFFRLPEFPINTLGDIQLNLEYQNHLISANPAPTIPGSVPLQREPDTLALKFVIKDNKGNKSDTVTLNNVIVIR